MQFFRIHNTVHTKTVNLIIKILDGTQTWTIKETLIQTITINNHKLLALILGPPLHIIHILILDIHLLVLKLHQIQILIKTITITLTQILIPIPILTIILTMIPPLIQIILQIKTRFLIFNNVSNLKTLKHQMVNTTIQPQTTIDF